MLQHSLPCCSGLPYAMLRGRQVAAGLPGEPGKFPQSRRPPEAPPPASSSCRALPHSKQCCSNAVAALRPAHQSGEVAGRLQAQ